MCIRDSAKKGAARVTADKEGYQTFIIHDNVGGRFSVLTPVGLLPIAVAGFDIEMCIRDRYICGLPKSLQDYQMMILQEII